MQDMNAQAEKLRTDAAECALIRDLATDPKKRDLFAHFAEPSQFWRRRSNEPSKSNLHLMQLRERRNRADRVDRTAHLRG